MGVLHIENRVILRLLGHLVEIKVQRRVVLPGQHVEPRHVRPHLLDDVAQSDERPRPFRHLERLAILVELHQLRQLDIQRHASARQRADGGIHPLDIAAMVGAENVDQLVEAPRDLVPMIGDIGREIGPGAVRLHDRAVHVVAMLGRLEQRLFPRLPILGHLALGRLQRALVDQALLLQFLDRRFDPARAVKGLLGIEDVHLHADGRQVLADQVHHCLGREIAHLFQPVCFRLVQKRVAVLFLQRLADGNQIIARIKPLGDLGRQAVRLAVPLIGRPRQHVDLRAAIIDVILPRDLIARKGQQRSQRVAKDRAPRMANVQGSGGVRADILDVYLHMAAHAGMAKAPARIDRLGHDIVPDGRLEPKIDETRPSHLGALDVRIVRQPLHQFLGNRARRLAHRLGQHHRRVRRHVPVRRVSRRLDRYCAPGQARGQMPVGHHGIQRFDDRGADFGEDVHLVLPSFALSLPREETSAISPFLLAQILRGSRRRRRGRSPLTPPARSASPRHRRRRRTARGIAARTGPSSPRYSPTRCAPAPPRRPPPRRPFSIALASSRGSP